MFYKCNVVLHTWLNVQHTLWKGRFCMYGQILAIHQCVCTLRPCQTLYLVYSTLLYVRHVGCAAAISLHLPLNKLHPDRRHGHHKTKQWPLSPARLHWPLSPARLQWPLSLARLQWPLSPARLQCWIMLQQEKLDKFFISFSQRSMLLQWLWEWSTDTFADERGKRSMRLIKPQSVAWLK